jgi:ABC-2 type transport system permease protein
MGFFLVLKAEVIRSLIIMRRYWFATLVGMVLGYGMLFGLVGALVYNREGLELWASTFLEKALGFIIGMFAFGVVGMFSTGLQGLARTGQLEQLYMSPHGLVVNFFARSFVSAVTAVLSSGFMLWVASTVLKGQLHAQPGLTILLLALTYLNLIGFGFMVGGLVLVFKQTGQVARLFQMMLLGLALFVTENVSDWPLPARIIAHIMPVTDAAICLKYAIIQGQTPPQEFLVFLVLNCIIWTTVGITLFRVMENWSRDKGTLGAY